MNLRRVRRRRGIGLLEVVISLTLSVVLLYVMVQWLVATMALSQASAENSDAVRDGLRVTTVFDDDVRAARSCQGDLGLPWASLTSSNVDLYRDVDDDGNLDLVSWELASGSVRRSVLVGDGSCTFDPAGRTWTTLSTLLAPYGPSEAAVSAIVDGEVLAAIPDCTDPASCALDALRLELRLRTPDGSVELVSDHTASFTGYWTQR